MTNLEAPIVRVMVAEDRAFVTRSVSVHLEEGEHKFEVHSVTPIVSDKTLLVETNSELVEVIESSVIRTTDLSASAKVQEKNLLDRRVSALENAIRRTRNEKVELREFAPQLFREIGDDAAWGGREQGEWGPLVEHLKAREQGLDAKLRGLESELKELRDKREPSDQAARSIEAAFHLTIQAQAPLTTELRITYCVPCASWRPAHRVSVDGERLRFTGLCYLWQNTGEDWSQVELNLSTERTAQTTSLPRLSADRLSLRDRDEEVVLSTREEAVERLEQGEVSLISTVPGIEDGGDVFSIAAPGRLDLVSDGQPLKVRLFEFEDVARFRHETKPEVLPQILTCSRQTNQSPYPLLPGPVELQKEGGALGTSWLKFTPSG
ncbi:MAG: mucoidy inhibitor MuiA family protein, partial [Candidatus Eremiobacteraeota bacterium]|nr:mucoidy inhibitor MuiA family protein [Candidatus Eremiobacteraeota bacterium]